MDSTAPPAEPVSAGPPHTVTRPLFTQTWIDVTFVHWRVSPQAIAPLLPPGVWPDVTEGSSYTGLVPFRVHRMGLAGLPGVPFAGSFPETNVRLYSVGPDGRRGVAFRSLDAARLVAVTGPRAILRLPYRWARMSVRRSGDVVTYTSSRRWPGPPGARLHLAVRIGEPLSEPSPLEHFLTARWGLHHAWYGGRPFYLPIEHPPWPLHRAELLELEEDLLTAAGLPAPSAGPVSVLYSPGLPMRGGLPHRLPR